MGRSVLVTGANSGIGLSTALNLAAHGFDVIGTVRDDAKAAVVANAAAERGLSVRTVQCDVTDAAGVEAAFAEVAEWTDGGPWALVNNAGYAQGGAIEDVDDETARAQLEVNVIAPARLIRLALPAMRARRDGRIVNMSSISGRVPLPLVGWYHASKTALEAVSDTLRMEVAPHGVRVVIIEPGSFGTNIWAEGLSRLPASTSGGYDHAYGRADALMSGVAHLPDPVWVARTVRLALSARNPMRRYLVGFDAMGLAAAESLLPDLVLDYTKQVVAGLRRPLR